MGLEYAVHLYGEYNYQGLLSTTEDCSELFHYTSSDTLLKILEKKQLRFSNRLYLNDRSEGKYILRFCIDCIDEVWPDTSQYKKSKFIEELKMLLDNMHQDHFQFYQTSFSLDGDNLTMWNYYGKEDGVNIRFNSSTLFQSLKKHLHNPVMPSTAFLYGPVIYDEQKQIEIIKRMLVEFTATKEFLDEWYMFTSWAILNIGTFFKHKGFRDEREYRIAYNLFAHPEEQTECLSFFSDIEYKQPYSFEVYKRENMLVPYVDVDFDNQALQSITLSPKLSVADYAQGLELILHKNKLFEVPITASEIPLRF